MTNATMIANLMRGFEPQTMGILEDDEVHEVRMALDIRNRDDIADLRILRNDVVRWFYENASGIKDMNKLSAITYVIDEAIWDLGGEV